METKYKDYTTTELLVMDVGRDYHDPELERELCNRAGLLGEFEAADGENFEKVVARAARILDESVLIY